MDEKLARAAILPCNRVRGIALRGPCSSRLFRELCHPFPQLESFKFSFPFPLHEVFEKIVPPTFLSPAPCLRRLTLEEVAPINLSSLLSPATGVVELTLTLGVFRYGALPEASLFANLRRLSCLRRLELMLNNIYHDIIIIPYHLPSPARDVVRLTKLTDLIVIGHAPYVEMIVAGLATPSLQHLDAEFWDGCPFFPIPNLCKFICDTECQLRAVRLDFTWFNVKFSAETCSESDHAQTFRITLPESFSLESFCNTLSGPLSTVEEFTVGWVAAARPSTQEDHIPWRLFFNHMPNVKTVRLTSEVPFHVAHSILLDSEERALDLLPALEYVKLEITPTHWQDASIRAAYEKLVAPRQRPITLSWTII